MTEPPRASTRSYAWARTFVFQRSVGGFETVAEFAAEVVAARSRTSEADAFEPSGAPDPRRITELKAGDGAPPSPDGAGSTAVAAEADASDAAGTERWKYIVGWADAVASTAPALRTESNMP